MPVKKKRKSSGSAAAAADDTGLKKCKLGRYRLAAGRGGAAAAVAGCHVPGERPRGWAAPPREGGGGAGGPAPLRTACPRAAASLCAAAAGPGVPGLRSGGGLRAR